MSDIVGIENIFINLDLKNKSDALRFITNQSKKLNICEDEEELFKLLLNRENEYSTNLGQRIAIPHVKSKYINKLSLIILKNKEEFTWCDDEKEKVTLIISILAPENTCAKSHLKILSNLSRKIINNDFKRMLINSKSEDETLYLINKALS